VAVKTSTNNCPSLEKEATAKQGLVVASANAIPTLSTKFKRNSNLPRRSETGLFVILMIGNTGARVFQGTGTGVDRNCWIMPGLRQEEEVELCF
jgi:hypothetical protein